MKRIILFFTAFAIACLSSFASKGDDKAGTTQHQLARNLDSLFTLSYIKGKSQTTDLSKMSKVSPADSMVYTQRLSKLQSIVELRSNSITLKYINFYTKYNKAKIEAMLGLSEHYFPMFERVLAEHELPLELKYLPLAESALYPNAVSQSGATGIWQLMYTIGKRYGLEINSYTDERRVVEKATHAAAKYLIDMYKIYRNWELAIAAYNCGPGNVNKAISRSGGKRNFWDIYDYLPMETRDHVAAYIGVVYLMNYAGKHKLKPSEIEIPADIDTLLIKEKLHLCQVSEVLHIPIKQLRELNLKYRKDIIHPAVDGSDLRLPKKYVPQFNSLRDSIFNYKDSVFFKPKKLLETPPVAVSTRSSYPKKKYSHSSSYSGGSTKGKAKVIYTVKSGDSVGLIAQWFDVRTSQIRYWNNLRGNKIIVGQKLKIYVPKSKKSTYQRLNSMSYDQKQRFAGKSSSSYTAASSISSSRLSSKNKQSGDYVYYKVRSGDNLWVIAKKYPGISHEDLKRINGFSDKYTLYPGQVIKIKRR